ncbi:MAG: TniQ family protein [Pseudomonas sp.]|uniref:TniQ family protein n=1 Tax=Pseudomonas sp. TaxID=306 RepID=UPI003D6DE047
MRSNALYSGLLKPLPQEALSSWLSRGGQSRNYLPFLRAIDYLERCGVQDVDVTITAKVEESLSKILDLPIECLRRAFPVPGDWLKMPPVRRHQVCEYCLYDDYRSGRLPSLRTTWFYWWFNVCPVHGGLLLESRATTTPDFGTLASTALFNILQQEIFIEQNRSWSLSGARSLWHRQNLAREPYKKLRLMALFFQGWYQASLQRGEFVIGNAKITATIDEWHLFMGDLLAIIGKKRSYPRDQKSYIARLLGIRSWSSLSTEISPSAGCEPFLCLDIGEHSTNIRMAMFALLGLFLKLPKCVYIWQLGMGSRLNDSHIERFWRGMHSDADRLPSYLQWLKKRSAGWNPVIEMHFRYLLND